MEKQLKVLMLNGSPREPGNIALAFQEMEQVFAENNVSFEKRRGFLPAGSIYNRWYSGKRFSNTQ